MKKKVLSYVKRYGTLILGLFLYAFAYNLFLKPNNIVAGDVDGIANIFKSIIDPNLLITILCVAVLIISFPLLG
ncbi:MAG: YitT family protein, partial [Tenericutes bacterium]|nr:YitT family protein [Mycoplasmatota bacterium]